VRTFPHPPVYEVPAGLRAAGSVQVPPSKSIAHRALILGALASGDTLVHPLPEGEDVEATLACLLALGVAVAREGDAVRVTGGQGRLSATAADLDCRSSGTTLRLLAAVCGVSMGRFRLDGSEQLRRRPLGPVADALAAMGAKVRFPAEEGCPPLEIEGARWRGGDIAVDSVASSQFLSGLLLASPLAGRPVRLQARNLVSSSYVRMTARLMARFGAVVEASGPAAWAVRPGGYTGTDVAVEPDASAAAFLFSAAAVTGGRVQVRGIARSMLQGDAALAGFLEAMGVGTAETPDGLTVAGFPASGLSADVRDCPDLVPPLVAVALFAPSPTTLEGVAHLRFKESDRLAVLAEAVSAVGGTMTVEGDRLAVTPAAAYRPARLDPRGDHRMAMAFAVMGLRIPGTVVLDPGCVAKSFPGFFETLESLLEK